MSKERPIPVQELLASIELGDRVTILIPNGIGCNGQEWKAATGRCVIPPDDRGQDVAVLNMGGRHGTAGVANEKNLVRIGREIAIPRITDQPRED